MRITAHDPRSTDRNPSMYGRQIAMAVAPKTAIEEQIRDTLVNFLHGVDFAERLWARADHGHITFWLLTAPVSHEAEREVYTANGLIYRAVPEARFSLLVVNPAMYEAPFAFEPPSGAQE